MMRLTSSIDFLLTGTARRCACLGRFSRSKGSIMESIVNIPDIKDLSRRFQHLAWKTTGVCDPENHAPFRVAGCGVTFGNASPT